MLKHILKLIILWGAICHQHSLAGGMREIELGLPEPTMVSCPISTFVGEGEYDGTDFTQWYTTVQTGTVQFVLEYDDTGRPFSVTAEVTISPAILEGGAFYEGAEPLIRATSGLVSTYAQDLSALYGGIYYRCVLLYPVARDEEAQT